MLSGYRPEEKEDFIIGKKDLDILISLYQKNMITISTFVERIQAATEVKKIQKLSDICDFHGFASVEVLKRKLEKFNLKII